MMTIASPPATGTIHAFALSPGFAGSGRCFSVRDSGIWRSEDGGATWRLSGSDGATDLPAMVTCISFAPDDDPGRTVFAGGLGAVLISRDGGDTWRPSTLPPPAPLVTCLAVSPNFEVDGVILAGTLEDGVLRSDDRGDRWRRWNFGLLDFSVYALAISPDFARDDTVFAGTETTLFRSENGGRSWRETSLPYGLGPVLAVAANARGTLWAGTEQHGIWRSPDQGETWQHDDRAVTAAVNGFVPAGEAMLAVLPDAILRCRAPGDPWRPVGCGLSDGGGIAGVAVATALPPHLEPFGGLAPGPGAGAEGIAASPGAGQPGHACIQLRDGSIRRIRIGDEEKGFQ